MHDETGIFVGGGGEGYGEQQFLRLDNANRHGLIAGATGTGKTVTLQILAEGFSARGVPVFLSDVKGDLSGLAKSGDPNFKLHGAFTERAAKIGITDSYTYEGFPVAFWDLFGEDGHPIRATVSEIGPLLLSRLLEAPPPTSIDPPERLTLAEEPSANVTRYDHLRGQRHVE